MTNNDVLRRLRYTFNLTDHKVVAIFALAERTVPLAQATAWLKKDDVEGYQRCDDDSMNAFLDGFIIHLRGAQPEAANNSAEGGAATDDKDSSEDDGSKGRYADQFARIDNNIILRKLKIALELRSDDMMALFESVGFRLGKSELSAFFRAPAHRSYRECQDQVLRNFLQGLQLKHRPVAPKPTNKDGYKKTQSGKNSADKRNTARTDKAKPAGKNKTGGKKVEYKNPNAKSQSAKKSDSTLSLKRKPAGADSDNSQNHSQKPAQKQQESIWGKK